MTNEDFIYRIKLNLNEKKFDPSKGKLSELIRSEIRDLLEIIVFFYKDERINVDSFAFINSENEKTYIYQD